MDWQYELAGRQLTEQECEQYGLTKEVLQCANVQFEEAIKQTTKGYCCQRCRNETEFERIPPQLDVYCLNCIQLGRLSTNQQLCRIPALENQIAIEQNMMTWQGKLSNEQQRASNDLVASLTDNERVHIVTAVTGAGKTEMIFEAIHQTLKKGGRVALASPRVDVCIELAPRIQAAFEKVETILLYAGATETFHYTPIVVATVHQLWRFFHAFDLIIVDEVDAFPLAADPSLHVAIKQALSPAGKCIYLTATPDKTLTKHISKGEATVTVLPARYHGYALPEPKFKWIGDWKEAIRKRKSGIFLRTIQQFLKIEGVKLIFMPDISLAEQLYDWLNQEQLTEKMAVVHSKDAQRVEKVAQLRQGILHCLISTSILERGVTFSNCHVLIVGAEDRAYTSAALIQMSGRVGRKVDFPTGTLIYAHFGKSKAMCQARSEIRKMNQEARQKGLIRDAT